MIYWQFSPMRQLGAIVAAKIEPWGPRQTQPRNFSHELR
jgi:hypothetical protein